MGMTLVLLLRMGTCILVGMSGLGLETPKLEKGVCVFPRKLGLVMGTSSEKERWKPGPPSSSKGSAVLVGSGERSLRRGKLGGARQWMNE